MKANEVRKGVCRFLGQLTRSKNYQKIRLQNLKKIVLRTHIYQLTPLPPLHSLLPRPSLKQTLRLKRPSLESIILRSPQNGGDRVSQATSLPQGDDHKFSQRVGHQQGVRVGVPQRDGQSAPTLA